MIARIASLFLIGSWTMIGPSRAGDEPAGSWRTLPLISDGKVDPSWGQIGWGSFVVDQGSLRTECDERGMGLLLYKKAPLGDCQIRVVYKSQQPKSNAGVFVRIDAGVLDKLNEKPAAARRNENGEALPDSEQQMREASENDVGPWYAVHHGYEVQICDDADEHHRTGAIYSLAKAAELPPPAKAGWRTMVITLEGNLVRVEVDGRQVTRFDSADKESAGERKKWYEPKREPKRPQTGYIGLQNHDPGDVVHFREVSVRPLKAAP